MTQKSNRLAVRCEQGFEAYVLGNRDVELAVVPQLGAKIISLKDLRTGREWMWHPADGLKLFANSPGDDFSASPLVGSDECLPTIAPCAWLGRELPDHGELWNTAWEVDGAAWEGGILKTCASLRVSPFAFERSIELQGNEIRLSYKLKNLSPVQEHFLWAVHPLLRLQIGDQLDLPASTRQLLNGGTWLNDLTSGMPAGGSAKLFASPLSEGRAAIKNPATGDRLEFEWNPAENNTLGLWRTCGGWHGHHHFALEATNGEPDALNLAANRQRCGVIAASGSATWRICIRIGS
jgi:hypothetical protein